MGPLYSLIRRGCLDVLPRFTISGTGVHVRGDRQLLIGDPDTGPTLVIEDYAIGEATSFSTASSGGFAEGLIAISPQFQGAAIADFVAVTRCGVSKSVKGIAVSGEQSFTKNGVAVVTSRFPHTMRCRASGEARAVVIIDLGGIGKVGLGGVLIAQIPEEFGPNLVAVAGRDIKPDVWYEVCGEYPEGNWVATSAHFRECSTSL